MPLLCIIKDLSISSLGVATTMGTKSNTCWLLKNPLQSCLSYLNISVGAMGNNFTNGLSWWLTLKASICSRLLCNNKGMDWYINFFSCCKTRILSCSKWQSLKVCIGSCGRTSAFLIHTACRFTKAISSAMFLYPTTTFTSLPLDNWMFLQQQKWFLNAWKLVQTLEPPKLIPMQVSGTNKSVYLLETILPDKNKVFCHWWYWQKAKVVLEVLEEMFLVAWHSSKHNKQECGGDNCLTCFCSWAHILWEMIKMPSWAWVMTWTLVLVLLHLVMGKWLKQAYFLISKTQSKHLMAWQTMNIFLNLVGWVWSLFSSQAQAVIVFPSPISKNSPAEDKWDNLSMACFWKGYNNE